jgi:ceramide glucosyltransferase
MSLIQIAAGLLLAAGTAYLGLALLRVAQWRPAPPSEPSLPPVSLLVPLFGAPPRLAECLGTLLAQDYAGEVQVVFGLHHVDDPARPVVERLMAEWPGRDFTLVVDPRRAGPNPKNCNLANMVPAARHDVLVMVDSDVLAPPDLLAILAATLTADTRIGLATCPYRGIAGASLWSRLGGLYIDDWFIPSVLVDVARRDMDFAYGAAIAVTRQALAAAGGFEAMAAAVAQDYVIGHAVSRAGFTVRLAPCIVGTIVAEDTAARLFAHELRWNRTIRAVRPLDHGLSIVTSPLLPFLLLALPSWSPGAVMGGAGLLLVLRGLLHLLLRRRLPLEPRSLWLLPVRECFNALVWAVSLTGRRIRWGDQVMVTGSGQTMRVDESGGGR